MVNFHCSPLQIVFDSLFDLQEVKTKNNWYLYLDKGWTITDEYAFKGIDSSWCKLDYSKGFKVTTNKLRDFPIYFHDTQVKNFQNIILIHF